MFSLSRVIITSLLFLIFVSAQAFATCSVKNYNTWGHCKVLLKPSEQMQIKAYNFGVPYDVANIHLQLTADGQSAMVVSHLNNAQTDNTDQALQLSPVESGGGLQVLFISEEPEDITKPLLIDLKNQGPSAIWVKVL